jgi:hypothetical protein
LAQLACMHAFLRWSRQRVRESGDALAEDGYYLMEGNWWRDLTDQVQSDPDFMLRAVDLLESSSEPAHRALAGEVLVGHQLHLARSAAPIDPVAEADRWRRLLDETNEDVRAGHRESIAFLTDSLRQIQADEPAAYTQGLLSALAQLDGPAT